MEAPKTKRVLTEAQRLAFMKGREKRLANIERRRQEKLEAIEASTGSLPDSKPKPVSKTVPTTLEVKPAPTEPDANASSHNAASVVAQQPPPPMQQQENVSHFDIDSMVDKIFSKIDNQIGDSLVDKLVSSLQSSATSVDSVKGASVDQDVKPPTEPIKPKRKYTKRPKTKEEPRDIQPTRKIPQNELNWL